MSLYTLHVFIYIFLFCDHRLKCLFYVWRFISGFVIVLLKSLIHRVSIFCKENRETTGTSTCHVSAHSSHDTFMNYTSSHLIIFLQLQRHKIMFKCWEIKVVRLGYAKSGSILLSNKMVLRRYYFMTKLYKTKKDKMNCGNEVCHWISSKIWTVPGRTSDIWLLINAVWTFLVKERFYFVTKIWLNEALLTSALKDKKLYIIRKVTIKVLNSQCVRQKVKLQS